MRKNHQLLLKPIIKRFSSPMHNKHLESPKKNLSMNLNFQPVDLQKHSRKSILNNLEDFLSNFSTKYIKEESAVFSMDQETLEKDAENLRIVSRQNLYEYMQDYLKIELEDDRDNENENGFGINEDEEKEKMNKELNDIPALYKQKYKSGIMKECCFLQVAKMNEIEKLKVDYRLYPDNLPFLWLRRNFLLFCK